MQLGKVIGTVVSTRKHPVLEGYKLLIVQPVKPDGRKAGGVEIALDTVQAGTGETVLLLTEGNSSRMIIGDNMAPVRAVVVGVVDAVESVPADSV
jgi:microcompartment protein CcmK/EutM